MKCPFCSKEADKVLESRVIEKGTAVRRRRECRNCKKRFTSYEKILEQPLWVIKRNGKKELYNREKLMAGVVRACHKRHLRLSEIEKMVSEAEKALHQAEGGEVKSAQIGEMALNKLKDLDQVAYVRFASVYRKFKNVSQFVREIKKIS